MSILCRLGLHSWPRMHSPWREVVVFPSTANCRRCDKPIASVFRRAYPEDGSRCKAGDCAIHGGAAAG